MIDTSMGSFLFNSVSLRESKELIVEAHVSMMSFLIQDIRLHLLDVGGADRESSIPFLPRETRLEPQLLFNPERRGSFNLANERRRGQLQRKRRKKMNVILDTTRDDRPTTEFSDNLIHALEQQKSVLHRDQRHPTLRRKGHVNQNVRQRIRHTTSYMLATALKTLNTTESRQTNTTRNLQTAHS